VLTNGHVLARFRLCCCARARCCDLTRALTRALTCSCGFTFVRLLVLIHVCALARVDSRCARARVDSRLCVDSEPLQSDVVECLFILWHLTPLVCDLCDAPMWCGVAWRDVTNRVVVWCGVVWCGVVWCDATRCDAMWCDVEYCDVM
jgi:hypothetical protein